VSDTSAKSHKQGAFRGTLLACALVLGCSAAWILAATYQRPSLPYFPATMEAVNAAAEHRKAATSAAEIGYVRGDLWADSALTYLNLFWSTGPRGAGVSDTAIWKRASDTADRALAYAPYDARVWLVRAVALSPSGNLDDKASAALRTSYYTGPNEIALIPLRLRLAVRAAALAERSFQLLVQRDLRFVVTHKPELKPAIEAAYRDASPTGKQFLEATLEELDPDLRTKLRTGG
jgi:hypothetical protein